MSTQSFNYMLDQLVKGGSFEAVDDYEDAVEALTHRPVDQPFYFEDPIQVKSALARGAY
ncbi:MAG TPA: hypothetical protein VN963_00055 [bacterium]|nr:hypothetical protein [bacterium]